MLLRIHETDAVTEKPIQRDDIDIRQVVARILHQQENQDDIAGTHNHRFQRDERKLFVRLVHPLNGEHLRQQGQAVHKHDFAQHGVVDEEIRERNVGHEKKQVAEQAGHEQVLVQLLHLAQIIAHAAHFAQAEIINAQNAQQAKIGIQRGTILHIPYHLRVQHPIDIRNHQKRNEHVENAHHAFRQYVFQDGTGHLLRCFGKILAHEPHIGRCQQQYDRAEIRPAIGGRHAQCPDVHQKLKRHVEQRHPHVGNMQFIGHNLVGMLAVGKEDVLMQHQPMDNRPNAVHPIDRQQDNPIKAAIRQDKAPQREQQDERDAHRTHIARKATCAGTEVEPIEHTQRQKSYPQDGGVHKSLAMQVGIQQSGHSHQTVSSRDAIDAIHEVVGIEDAGAEYQSHQNVPPREMMEQAPFVEHQQHGGKMENNPHLGRHGMHIIHETNEANQRQPGKEPRVRATEKQGAKQHAPIEHDAPAAQSDPRVGASFVRLVDDAETMRQLEIQPFAQPQQGKDRQITDYSFNVFHSCNLSLNMTHAAVPKKAKKTKPNNITIFFGDEARTLIAAGCITV